MTTGYRGPSPALLSMALLGTEAPRAGLDLAALLGSWPLLAAARSGDGHPVLVLPGLFASDPPTLLLRNVLRALGHDASGWSLGTNQGPNLRVVEAWRARGAPWWLETERVTYRGPGHSPTGGGRRSVRRSRCVRSSPDAAHLGEHTGSNVLACASAVCSPW